MEKPEELEKVILDRYRQLANQQINQSPMQQGIAGNWANALGGALGGMHSRMAQGWYQPQSSSIPYPPYQMPMGSLDYGDRITFSRINDIVEISEYDTVNIEPLDELRIKVAKWLYN